MGNDAAIFDDADPIYRRSVMREVSDRTFDQVRALLGEPLTTTLNGGDELPSIGSGKVYRMNVLTTFTKGSSVEQIIVHYDESRDCFRMLGYEVTTSNTPHNHFKVFGTP